MMTDEITIEIHQTIHGYRDGHELLASSMQLPSPVRRAMLALSDLSGDGSPRGFEEYLSGYSIEEAGMYAFARTWYASEMKRPGCVWTHTLLIEQQDLGRISQFGGLRQYFRRPDSKCIRFTLPSILHQCRDESEAVDMKLDGALYEIMMRLYGQDLPVLIFGDDANQYEDTIIQVWSQQFNRLRRSFAFCTGALEPRLVEKRPFDLQVIPRQRQRRTLRSADVFSIVTDEDIVRSTDAASRVRRALAQFSPQDEQVTTPHFGIKEMISSILSRK